MHFLLARIWFGGVGKVGLYYSTKSGQAHLDQVKLFTCISSNRSRYSASFLGYIPHVINVQPLHAGPAPSICGFPSVTVFIAKTSAATNRYFLVLPKLRRERVLTTEDCLSNEILGRCCNYPMLVTTKLFLGPSDDALCTQNRQPAMPRQSICKF